MPKLTVQIGAKISGLIKDLRRAKRNFQSFKNDVNIIAQPLRNITAGVAGFGAAIGFGIAKLGAYAGKLQQTKIAMEVFLGSAEKAKALISDLRQFADVTPFDTGTIIQAGKLLTGAGFEAKKVVGIVRMLGDVSAGTGKDILELSNLWAQSMNRNKIQTRGLNQMIRAGIPIIAMLAKQMDTTKDKIFKLAENGKIKFSDLNKVFKTMTSQGGIYAGLMEKQSQTLLGRWSTLEGKIQNLTTDVGGPLLNSMTSITDTFIDWTNQARNLKGPIGFLIRNLRGIAGLLELTREGASVQSVTGLKGYGKGDLIADTLARHGYQKGDKVTLGSVLNPMNIVGAIGTGMQAAGFGLKSNQAAMSLIDQETKDLLKTTAEASQKTANNTESRGF